LNRLTGETRRFIDRQYSDDLRIRLLGQATAVESVDGRYGEKIRDTNYVYRNKGVVITVSPRIGAAADVSGKVPMELTSVTFVSFEATSR
jgi:hypothetical protein